MINKQEREDLLKEYELLQSAWGDMDFPMRLGFFADNVPKLLDNIDELEDQKKAICVFYEKKYKELEARAEKAEAERDALIRRIVKQIKTSIGHVGYFACEVCDNKPYKREICHGCFGRNFRFDYERFAKGGGDGE